MVSRGRKSISPMNDFFKEKTVIIDEKKMLYQNDLADYCWKHISHSLERSKHTEVLKKIGDDRLIGFTKDWVVPHKRYLLDMVENVWGTKKTLEEIKKKL